MLVQAHDVRDTVAYSYRLGEASFIELLDAQRTFNETMQSYNDARGEFARSLEEFRAELANEPEQEDAKKQISEVNSKLTPAAR